MASGEQKRILVKQIRSGIGFPEPQKRILFAMRLKKIGRVRSFPDTAAVRGMVAKIPHLVEIVES
jgi:large subunit ribosomal protein L30